MRGGTILMLAAVLAPAWLAHGDEVLPELKVNGQFYTNVTITKVSATDIFFTSSNGMGNAKLKNLDRKLRKHFHYDAAKAKLAERQQAADAAEYHLQVLHDYPEPAGSLTNRPVSYTDKPIWAKSFLGHTAPPLYVEEWLTPTPDCRNKFILYDFWDTTNAACRAEIRELNAYQNEFSDRLVIIGISDEPAATVQSVADPLIEYAVAIDKQARTENAVGVTAVPHLMLIDPRGYVRWEGYPFLKGHEFSNKVLTDLMDKYDIY